MQDKFSGFSEESYPNSGWFPYPNELVAYWPTLKKSELLVLNYIMRRTIGFQKKSDHISYSKFLHGVGNLDNGCGIKSSSTLSLALQGLVDKGFITKVGGSETGRTNHYSLVIKKHNSGLQNSNTPSSDTKEQTSSKTEDTINTSINNNQYITSDISNENRSKNYSDPSDITDDDVAEIAAKCNAPITFVSRELDKLCNYCAATGKTYKDYKKALCYWVLKDIQKKIEDIPKNQKLADLSHLG